MPDEPRSVEWIDTPQALSRAAARWSSREAIALDTEFVRERTFYPRIGLVQIADEEGVFLVDPLAVPDLEPLRRVLERQEVVKVAHSCSEDLEVLYHAVGCFPAPTFDTQTAAALAGDEPSLSYQRLVQVELGIDLPKGETRTDWLQRPLSEAQLRYAALDAHWLLPLYRRLREKLAPAGRVGWVLEDTARLADVDRFWPDPEQAYLRLGGIGGMNPRQLAVARRLASWRETRARERDLPRNFVLKHTSLIAIARRLPERPEDLADIPDLPPRQAGKLADHLLRLAREARSEEAGSRPQPTPRLPSSEALKKLHDELHALVKQRSRALAVPAPVLASRRDLRDLVGAIWQGEPVPPPFDGWRWQALGAGIEELFARARERGHWQRALPIPPHASQEVG